MASPICRSASRLSLAAVAPLLLAVAGALACSAPPGSLDEEEEDGPAPYGGSNSPGTNPGMNVGGLQPAPPNPAAPSANGNNGAGGSSGSEAPGSNVGLNPAPAPNSNGQAPNVMQPPVGAAGSSGMVAPGSGGAGAMPPVTPPPTMMQPPPVTPPPTMMQPPPVTPPPVVTPPPAANAGCAGQFLCDDFEGVAAGASPRASTWALFDNYNPTSVSANVQVSAAEAHGGRQSVRVAAASGRSGIVATLPQSSYFMRAWLQVEAAPRGPVLIGLGSDQNAETRLRIFNQSWATINAVPGDAVRPQGATSGNCPTCVTLVPNQWFCAEMSVDNAARTVTLWIDDVEAAVLTNAPAQPAAPKMFVGSMGLEGGQAGVWIDDVVAGPARIGCD